MAPRVPWIRVSEGMANAKGVPASAGITKTALHATSRHPRKAGPGEGGGRVYPFPHTPKERSDPEMGGAGTNCRSSLLVGGVVLRHGSSGSPLFASDRDADPQAFEHRLLRGAGSEAVADAVHLSLPGFQFEEERIFGLVSH